MLCDTKLVPQILTNICHTNGRIFRGTGGLLPSVCNKIWNDFAVVCVVPKLLLCIHYCIQYYYCISVVICLQSVICLCLENSSVSSKKSALFNKVRLVQNSHSRLFFRKLPTLFTEGYVLSYNKTKFIYIPQGFPA